MNKNENLITIGELSKLTGVHIKSLRYYDEIGILNPVYVNPDSGYRYFSYTQIHLVEAIQFYIDMNVPLREIHSFISDRDNQKMDFMELVSHGITLAKERIRYLESRVEIAVELQQLMRRTIKIKSSPDGSIEKLPAKDCLIIPFDGKIADKNFYKALIKLKEMLKSYGLHEGYENGLLSIYENGTSRKYLFIDIMGLSDNLKNDPHYLCLPSKNYICKAETHGDINSAPDYFPEQFSKNSKNIVIETELFLYNFDNRYAEYELRIILEN